MNGCCLGIKDLLLLSKDVVVCCFGFLSVFYIYEDK